MVLWIFEAFVRILLIVNPSLNQTLLTFLLYVRQIWMTHWFWLFLCERFQANIFCFSRRLEDAFQCNNFWSFKMSSRILRKMPSSRFQDVFKTSSKTSSPSCLEDVFKMTTCNYALKTSLKTKKCYSEDVLKTSSPRQMFDRSYFNRKGF